MATRQPTLSYWQKLRGVRLRSDLAAPHWREALASGLGGAIALSGLHLLTVELRVVPCFLVPFGASCALVFGLPGAAVSQPRNVVGGHVLSALIGLAVYLACGQTAWWTLALAMALAMTAMSVTATYHPPAAVTVLLPVLQKISDPVWVLAPVGLGAILLVVIAVLYNNLYPNRHYPTFWW